MPLVTVPARPSGEPMATTGSPTTTSSELPSAAVHQARLLDLEDGDVAGRVAPDDAGRRAAAVGEHRPDLGALDPVGAGDDVVVRDDVAVVALDDDAGAGRRRPRPTRTSIETTAGVTLSAMSDDRAGLAGDARVDLGQLRARGQQRGLVLRSSGQVPADAAADGRRPAGRRAGRATESRTERSRSRSFLRPCGSTTIGPGLGSPRRRRRARRGRPARTGRATGSLRASGFHHGPVAVRRRPGRPPGGSCRPRCPVPAGPKARSSASAGGGGAGRGGGSGRSSAKPPSTAAGRPNAACWPGVGDGAVTGRGASRSGTSSNGPVRPGGRANAASGGAGRPRACGRTRGRWSSEVLRGSRPGRRAVVVPTVTVRTTGGTTSVCCSGRRTRRRGRPAAAPRRARRRRAG